MDGTFTIKPYEPTCRDATARLWLDSFKSTGLKQADDVALPELIARIPKEMAGGWSAYLAWCGGEMVGFLALKPETSCLDQLFICPSAQGHGFGAQLLEFAKAALPKGMWLSAAVENRGALRFYERHGFRPGEVRIHPRFGHEIIIYHWP